MARHIFRTKKGETWNGLNVTLTDTVTQLPIDLTDAVIRADFYIDSDFYTEEEIVFTMSTANGKLLLTDPSNGKFIFIPHIIAQDIAVYDFRTTFVFPSGKTKVYLTAQLVIYN